MARKRKGSVNLSAAIRDYLKVNPSAGPTEAATAISEQVGKKVSPTYVSNIKSISKEKPKKLRRGRRPQGAAVTSQAVHKNGGIDLVTIAQARALVGRIGADTAKQLIDVLA